MLLNELQNKCKLVIFKGNGKIVSSGGDIKELSSYDANQAKEFFKHPLRLFHLVSNFKIPFVAIMNGINFGAASNLTVASKNYRIATETTDFAMPEAKIGFINDNGSSYFLSRLPRNIGFYISFAAPRIKGYDVKKIGLADYYTKNAKLPELEEELIKTHTRQDIEEVLNKYSSSPSQNTELEQIIPKIDKCFDGDCVEEIIENLHLDGSDWAMKTVQSISSNSPTSLKLCHKELTLGKSLSLEECLKMEYRLAARHFSEESDFYIGVKSLLIDRDNNPQWRFKSLKEVKTDYIDDYFKPLPAKQELVF